MEYDCKNIVDRNTSIKSKVDAYGEMGLLTGFFICLSVLSSLISAKQYFIFSSWCVFDHGAFTHWSKLPNWYRFPYNKPRGSDAWTSQSRQNKKKQRIRTITPKNS